MIIILWKQKLDESEHKSLHVALLQVEAPDPTGGGQEQEMVGGDQQVINSLLLCRRSLIINSFLCRRSLIFNSLLCRRSLIFDSLLCMRSFQFTPIQEKFDFVYFTTGHV